MKKLIIAASAAAMLFTGAAASAQPAQRGNAEMRTTSQADALARADQRFQRLDSNRDGRLTRTELQAGKQRPGAKAGQQRGRAEARKRGQKGASPIERLDSNRDGVISHAEFRSHAVKRFANRDGQRHGQHRGGQSQPQARR